MDLISINKDSNQPKYIQIVTSVISSIEKGKLKRGAQLPSISELAESQQTAKVTVAKAYERLRQMGVILSQHGKGFYVAKTDIKNQLNIFVLFDSLNAYKEVLYNALKAALPPDTQFSIFFHHYDKDLFESLISNNLGNFNYYIVMPHFDEDVSAIVNTIPRDKLLLIDKDVPQLKKEYAAVYQDFESDVFNSLQAGADKLKRYKRLNLVLGKEHFQYVPREIIRGYKKFIRKSGMAGQVIDTLSPQVIIKGEAYLIFSDSDMIRFIKNIMDRKMELGKDIGMISYDDTPLKEILMGGITVISTDFAKMGTTAGKLIAKGLIEKMPNPAQLILRRTL